MTASENANVPRNRSEASVATMMSLSKPGADSTSH
jgi:hypothetical protein